MDKKFENKFSYADISGRMLERMMRFTSEGDFSSAFSRMVDLTKEDDSRFDEFLKAPEIQQKIANRIKNIA